MERSVSRLRMYLNMWLSFSVKKFSLYGELQFAGDVQGAGKRFFPESLICEAGQVLASVQVVLMLVPRFAKIPRILLLLALIGKIRHRKRYLSFIHEDTIMRQPTPL